MKPKAEDKKRMEALVIIKQFNYILNTWRYYGLKEYEVFNRQIFVHLPHEWKMELFNRGKSEGIKEVIEDLEQSLKENKYADTYEIEAIIKKWKAKI